MVHQSDLKRSMCLCHTCHKLWTKICEIRQNFKGDLTKFCEVFLNITMEFPQYNLKSFFFLHVRSLWKPQHCVIYVFFFIKYVVKWSENSVRFEFFMGIAFQMGHFLWDFISQCEIWYICFVASDNILKMAVTILMEETVVDNFL